MERKKQQIIKDASVIMHPIRYEIIEYLNRHSKGEHIQKIADHLEKDRRVISYHLLELEGNGFVKGNYEISSYPNSKGKAIKKYTLTDKINLVKFNIKELLSTLL